MAKAGRGADQYMLRFPPGLRDRIKAYAERQGTSINSEIIRILEREFPEQWPVDERLTRLAEGMSVLAAGKGDPRFDQFVTEFEETVEGIVSGRVTGVDAETRESVSSLWNEYQQMRGEAQVEAYQAEYTEDEERSLSLVGRPEKYAEPPPEKADPVRDYVHLSNILPKYDLAELTRRLSQADIEGAKGVLDNLQPEKLREQIRLANMSMWDRMDMGKDDPFEDEK